MILLKEIHNMFTPFNFVISIKAFAIDLKFTNNIADLMFHFKKKSTRYNFEGDTFVNNKGTNSGYAICVESKNNVERKMSTFSLITDINELGITNKIASNL